MDRRKIEVKYIEDNSTRQATFSKRRADIFKKADELATLCSVAVAVLINCPVGQPHMYRSPGFDEVLGNFQNPYPERERSSSSLKQARIQKMQDRLNRIMEELEAEKEREKVLKKRKEETLKKYNMKEVASLKLEELVAFKKMLEAHRDIIKHERMEKEASSSLLMLSKNRKKKNNKKKKMMT